MCVINLLSKSAKKIEGTICDPRSRVLIENSLASNLPLQLASGHHTTHEIERDGQIKVEVAAYPLCQGQPTSKRRPVPDRQKEHNENTVSKDSRSLTDKTQIKIYTKIYKSRIYCGPRPQTQKICSKRIRS